MVYGNFGVLKSPLRIHKILRRSLEFLEVQAEQLNGGVNPQGDPVRERGHPEDWLIILPGGLSNLSSEALFSYSILCG